MYAATPELFLGVSRLFGVGADVAGGARAFPDFWPHHPRGWPGPEVPKDRFIDKVK